MSDGTRTTEKARRQSRSESGFWPGANGDLLEAWARSNADLVKGAISLAEEVIQFGQRRLAADLDAWRTATSCRNPSELAACQRHFAEEAMAQYLAEADKLTRGIVGLMSGTVIPLVEGGK
jgi:hypothetical protein